MAKRVVKKTATNAEDLKVLVGSFALETLTTGMYTEPRDCVREYVQNAFDAIEAARARHVLGPSEGQISIVLSPDNGGALAIRDDGVSIPADSAWETLTSIGASRKTRNRHAGFRGIGRLAGMAYCERLEYICKAPGEAVTSHIVFQSARMIKLMREEGDQDLLQVFLENIESVPAPYAGSVDDHFTEVRMVGLQAAPEELTKIGLLQQYLASSAPVDFRDGMHFSDKIKAHAKAIG